MRKQNDEAGGDTTSASNSQRKGDEPCKSRTVEKSAQAVSFKHKGDKSGKHHTSGKPTKDSSLKPKQRPDGSGTSRTLTFEKTKRNHESRVKEDTLSKDEIKLLRDHRQALAEDSDAKKFKGKKDKKIKSARTNVITIGSVDDSDYRGSDDESDDDELIHRSIKINAIRTTGFPSELSVARIPQPVIKSSIKINMIRTSGNSEGKRLYKLIPQPANTVEMLLDSCGQRSAISDIAIVGPVETRSDLAVTLEGVIPGASKVFDQFATLKGPFQDLGPTIFDESFSQNILGKADLNALGWKTKEEEVTYEDNSMQVFTHLTEPEGRFHITFHVAHGHVVAYIPYTFFSQESA